jgi:hypothetical protein
VNLLLAFLASIRRGLPPWARASLADSETFLAALRGLPRTTLAAILLCTALIYALKAVFIAVLTLLIAATWLLEKSTKSPGAHP